MTARSKFNILRSSLDESANLIDLTEGIETRVVHRPGKTIIYVSSQTGCVQGCQMCWLTHNKGNSKSPRNLTVAEILAQVRQAYTSEVPQHLPKEHKLYVDFMAKGEPLANPHLLADGDKIVDTLAQLFEGHTWRMNVSSILPKKFLAFGHGQRPPSWLLRPEVRLYWSWYSEDPDFRAEWLPASPRYTDVLWDFMHSLADARGDKTLNLHWALIRQPNTSQQPRGENSSPSNLAELCQRLTELPQGLRAKINLVHLNPPGGASWEEASPEVLKHWLQTLQQHPRVTSAMLKERVGFDVYASCGMFAT